MAPFTEAMQRGGTRPFGTSARKMPMVRHACACEWLNHSHVFRALRGRILRTWKFNEFTRMIVKSNKDPS